MRRLATSLAIVSVFATGSAAWAQDEFGDPIDIPGEGEEEVDDGGSTVALEAEGEATVDDGGGEGAGLGVGVHAMLSGPFGAAIIYDPGAFHIEGMIGFASNGTTAIALGGRFWYHLHTSTAADFSLGGGLGLSTVDDDPEDQNNVHIDAGAQLRAFVVPNVALSATLGLAIVTGDADFVGLTGQLVGGLGISYFF